MKQCPCVRHRTVVIDTPLIHGNEPFMDLPKRLVIDIYEIQEVRNVDHHESQQLKGSNDISPSTVRDSFVFEEKLKKKTRVTIILMVTKGREHRRSNPLLLMRFHAPPYQLNKKKGRTVGTLLEVDPAWWNRMPS